MAKPLPPRTLRPNPLQVTIPQNTIGRITETNKNKGFTNFVAKLFNKSPVQWVAPTGSQLKWSPALILAAFELYFHYSDETPLDYLEYAKNGVFDRSEANMEFTNAAITLLTGTGAYIFGGSPIITGSIGLVGGAAQLFNLYQFQQLLLSV